jgi:hypothetical protein
MTLRAYLITLRGRIREALVPELQVLRNRLAKAESLADKYKWQTIHTCTRAEKAEADAKEWTAIAGAAIKRAGELSLDARRGRFLLDKMRHQNCEPHAGWALTGIYPGNDPASAVDAAMNKERGDDN